MFILERERKGIKSVICFKTKKKKRGRNKLNPSRKK